MASYIYGSPQKKRIQTQPEKRSCSEHGCTTRLSIYNPSPFCWLHESAAPKRGLSPTR
jgi:hypothetical protein